MELPVILLPGVKSHPEHFRVSYYDAGHNLSCIPPQFATLNPGFAMHCCICVEKKSVKHACSIPELLCRH